MSQNHKLIIPYMDVIYHYYPQIDATSIEYSLDFTQEMYGARIIKLIPGDCSKTVESVLNRTYFNPEKYMFEKWYENSLLDYNNRSPNNPEKVKKQMDELLMEKVLDATNSSGYSNIAEMRAYPYNYVKKIKGQEVKPLILDFRTIRTTDKKYTEFYLDKICELVHTLQIKNPEQIFEIVFCNGLFESWNPCVDLEESVIKKANENGLTIIQDEKSHETILRSKLPKEAEKIIDIREIYKRFLPLVTRMLGKPSAEETKEKRKLPPVK